MKRGIGLMSDGRLESVDLAVSFFDEALELRKRLPVGAVPQFRYGLAACWLNRAEALMRLGGSSRVTLAVHAFDQAIILLRALPLQVDKRFPRRLAIALQNRGLALQALGTDVQAAIDAFTQAKAVLDHDQSAAIRDRSYLLAAVCTNLADAYASGALDSTGSLASASARRALALMKDLEGRAVDAAAVALKARHVLCRTLAGRLSLHRDATPLPDEVHDATDLADEGLDLVRRWEAKGETRFRDIALDLFRFGSAVYRTHQPQFFEEFVLDYRLCVSLPAE